jgi:AcrR family transcriptional regulator
MATRRSTRGEARGSELVALARSVLVEEGLDRFVLRDIAARAGMTVGNLQYYFPTRDDLLTSVVRAELDRDLAVLRPIIDGRDRPLTEVAGSLVRDWCDGGSNVYAAVALLAFHHERFRDLNREVYEAIYAELGPLLRAADPGADECELAGRARLVTALLDGVAAQVHAAVWDDDGCDDLRLRATSSLLAIVRRDG